MITLAINCATEHMYIALHTPERNFQKIISGPTMRSELLTTYIEQLLQEANLTMTDLNAIGIAIGPGAFTGLRLSLVTAKTLSLALKIPLTPLSTLEALALQYADQKNTKQIMIDTCRGDIAVATFDAHGKRLTNDLIIAKTIFQPDLSCQQLYNPEPDALTIATYAALHAIPFDRQAIQSLAPHYSHPSRVNKSSKPELQHLKIGLA